ncbi:hypothetical protein HKX48_003537 [Thoreauomyces humboldtii]|nr:hypothetical protein HKX48_003537 [Thoreauomyces humboldtii]
MSKAAQQKASVVQPSPAPTPQQPDASANPASGSLVTTYIHSLAASNILASSRRPEILWEKQTAHTLVLKSTLARRIERGEKECTAAKIARLNMEERKKDMTAKVEAWRSRRRTLESVLQDLFTLHRDLTALRSTHFEQRVSLTGASTFSISSQNSQPSHRLGTGSLSRNQSQRGSRVVSGNGLGSSHPKSHLRGSSMWGDLNEDETDSTGDLTATVPQRLGGSGLGGGMHPMPMPSPLQHQQVPNLIVPTLMLPDGDAGDSGDDGDASGGFIFVVEPPA